MSDLTRLLEPTLEWSLEELVREANALLPEVLPEEAGRTGGDVSSRTVRYYTSEGVLDPPGRSWREARYGGRHLLQLLVARKLLAEGYTIRALVPEVRKQTDLELLALLQRPMQVTLKAVPSGNAALDYLDALEVPSPKAARLSSTRSRSPQSSQPHESVRRLRLGAGLELLVDEDYLLPRSAAEWQTLLEEVEAALRSLQSTRKPSNSRNR